MNPILLRAAAVSARRTGSWRSPTSAADGVAPARRRSAPSRARRAQPFVRGARRRRGRGSRSMTGRGEPERLDGQRVSAQLLPRARRAPGDRTRLRPIGRSARRTKRRDPQRRAVARRRFAADPRDRRSARSRSTTRPYRDRRHAGRASRTSLAPSARDLGTAPVRRGAAASTAREWGHHWQMVGALGGRRDGRRQAARELDVPSRARRSPEFPRPPWATMTQGLLVRSLQDDMTRARASPRCSP